MPIGVAIGLLAPVAAYVLTKVTAWDMQLGGKPLSIYVIAALINLLLVRFFYRNARERSARGVILITFAAALLLIFTDSLK